MYMNMYMYMHMYIHIYVCVPYGSDSVCSVCYVQNSKCFSRASEGSAGARLAVSSAPFLTISASLLPSAAARPRANLPS